MDLMNITEHVIKTAAAGAALWIGAQLAKWAWRRIEAYATKLRTQINNNALISPQARRRIEHMRDLTLVICFVTMLSLQISATGPTLQPLDVVMLSTWTWRLLATLQHIARKP